MDIADLQRYYHGFQINTPEGNNAFSWDKRRCQTIHVPPLIKGTLADVQPGDQPVFSDVVDGREVSIPGLKHLVHIQRGDQNIFIIDNHNHAFACWAAAIRAGVLALGLRLVHVDQHKDTRDPDGNLPPADAPLDVLCAYTNHVLNVGNFIPPALQLGWFSEVVQVQTRAAFDLHLEPPFVLDIDLDVFAPVMAYIPDDLKIARLRAWIRRADLITIATSPFFMDQGKAIDFIKEVTFQ